MTKRRDRDMAQSLVRAAIDHNQAGRPGDALAAYREALRLDPDNSLAANGIALLMSAFASEPAHLDEALRVAEGAILAAKDPVTKALLVSTLAEVRLRRGELQQAIQDSVACLRMLGAKASPMTKATVFRRIGTAHQFLGNTDWAMQAFRLAVAANPADVNCRMSLARLANDRRDHATAIAEYTSAISTVAGARDQFAKPDQLLSTLLNDRGCVYLAVGDYGRSQADFHLAAQVDPQQPYPYVNIAFDAGRHGDRAGMRQHLDTGLRLAGRGDFHLMNMLLTEVAVGLNGDVILEALFANGRITEQLYQKHREGLRMRGWQAHPQPVNALPIGTPWAAGADADPMAGGRPKARIVVFAANPLTSDRLALDEEIREIVAALRATTRRDAFELVPCLAARANDLLQYLNQYTPHIVHFSAHGSQTGEIVLVADGTFTQSREITPASGYPTLYRAGEHAVSAAALGELFRVMKDNVQVVVLNACYSVTQAKAISEHIDYVVGMRRSIRDDAATVFAAAFYSALGENRAIVDAFDQGRVALLVNGIPEQDVPELLVRPGASPKLVFGA
ncbi:CHAT domain-containing protein [Solwaraspora sp. WMMD406]|uniref:CHAT domain-containing tetratricopeptide repeat protein n=1 Tax=Solwaraspora sp. WMMD406 TaxID=3016095 RepID=UPI0024161CFD|nr:CHAT domain-containing protein [Solwaraspora sp. WMMD406]MDG4765887.1 CHAT domain-containing protein [Solwaraspora sp. WMMD406]